ncbi:hypothetical protein LWI28_014773 [Acer negundo]|uniref:Uncharacterized protein n=1 Tax=Acer negundo TaxID=4023 RepID=A0AAD5IRQ1_ACENE|nr:hypothetical protein LWI28_014773 [Acer negundo]
MCISSPIELLKEQTFHSSSKLRPGLQSSVAADKVSVDKIAVIELFFPSVFRAEVSLHPVGSIDPNAVAFFPPDEGGSYMHARGFSVYHVFRHTTHWISIKHYLLKFAVSVGGFWQWTGDWLYCYLRLIVLVVNFLLS